ncbi:MAG: hypothetical protein GC190_07425 [Alphaproteobacteria bacterium]|nr:hypothetical protein [Alphaproteobacteria bacterium]
MAKAILFEVLRLISFGAVLFFQMVPPSSTEDPVEVPLPFLVFGGVLLVTFLLLSYRIALINSRWGIISTVLYVGAFEFYLVLALSVHGVRVW